MLVDEPNTAVATIYVSAIGYSSVCAIWHIQTFLSPHCEKVAESDFSGPTSSGTLWTADLDGKDLQALDITISGSTQKVKSDSPLGLPCQYPHANTSAPCEEQAPTGLVNVTTRRMGVWERLQVCMTTTRPNRHQGTHGLCSAQTVYVCQNGGLVRLFIVGTRSINIVGCSQSGVRLTVCRYVSCQLIGKFRRVKERLWPTYGRGQWFMSCLVAEVNRRGQSQRSAALVGRSRRSVVGYRIDVISDGAKNFQLVARGMDGVWSRRIGMAKLDLSQSR